MKTYVVDYEKKDDFLKLPLKEINSKRSILIQIFSGICDRDRLKKVVIELKDIFPKASIIGATTDGEIIDDEVKEERIVVSISSFDKTDVKIAFVKGVSQENSFKKGAELAKKLKCKNAKVLISFADGLLTNGEDFVKGIGEILEDTVLSGGLAGDNARFKNTFTICGEEILEDGAVGAVLINKNLIVSTDYRFGWIPIGKKLKITSAVGNRVYRIENMKAVDAYRHYLGEETANMLPKTGIEFPLITIKNGIEIARAVIAKNGDGSLEFAGNIKVGEYYQFGLGNIDFILNSLDKVNKKFQHRAIESVFVYSCMARRRFFKEGASIEVSYLSQFAKTVGFFTYGEFYHLSAKKNEFLNETMTVLALSETPKVRSKKVSRNFKTDEGYISTLKALSHLVAVTNNELEHIHEMMDFERNIFVQGPVIIVKIKPTRNFDVEYISPNVINHFGYSAFDFFSKKISFKDIIFREDYEKISSKVRDLVTKRVNFFEEEFRVLTRDKKVKVFDAYIVIDRDSRGKISSFNGYFLDVTKRKEMENRLQYMAYHDTLTDIPNRAYLNDKIDNLVEMAKYNKSALGFLYFDLNGFKNVNDTLGHHIGDELLRVVAASIKRVIRGEDIFLRLGGDEFLIILTFLDERRAKEAIRRFSKRIFDIFSKSIKINGHEIKVSTSMGASIFPKDSDKIEDVLKFADKAMYEAKKRKLRKVLFFSEIEPLKREKESKEGKFLIKDTI